MVLERVVQLRALVAAYRERHPALLSQPGPTSPLPQKVRPIRTADVPVLTDRCPQCRAELRPGWKFCPRCGTASAQADDSA
jgi:hypothetical protein